MLLPTCRFMASYLVRKQFGLTTLNTFYKQQRLEVTRALSTSHESSSKSMLSSSVVEHEIEKFGRLSKTWWDPFGPVRPLHEVTSLRVSFIRRAVSQHPDASVVLKNSMEAIDQDQPYPLKGLSVLDVGCGGGLLAEPMARLGASVLGVDAAESNILSATEHARINGFHSSNYSSDADVGRLDYRCCTAEQLLAERESYDVVVASEVVEHVNDVNEFVNTCCSLVNPGGVLVITTINRTMKAYGLAIILAEKVLGWAESGTHDYHSFVTPQELTNSIRTSNHNMRIHAMTGMVFDPLNSRWMLKEHDIDVNYFVAAAKPHST